MIIDKKKINSIFDELYPICRSIAGSGFNKSLNILKKNINFKLHKIKSGTRVFDWKVPNEWELIDAYITYNNKKILDAKKNNISVVNYSTSIEKTVNLKELKKIIFTHPKLKNAIPYVTSYYHKSLGFCMSENQKNKLKEGKYKILIKTKKNKGFLTYGVAKLKGNSNKNFLLSSFLCHPSMANNELSGPLTLLGLYSKLKNWKNRNLNYDFLINPETIGSICYLHENKENIKNKIHSGVAITCMGGKKNQLSYFKSRFSKSPLDRLSSYLANKGKILINEFNPTEGGDERQYCASEFNLPIGRLQRTGPNEYKEYHTHLDNKSVMNINKVLSSINNLETILKYNDYLFPIRRHEKNKELYPKLNTYENTQKKNTDIEHKIIMTILSYADGNYDYLDITKKFNFPIDKVLKCIKLLINKNLIFLEYNKEKKSETKNENIRSNGDFENLDLKYNDYLFPIRRHEKYCELFLSKKELYPKLNTYENTQKKNTDIEHKIIMTILSYADGNYDYLDITKKFNFSIDKVLKCIKLLINKNLIFLENKKEKTEIKKEIPINKGNYSMDTKERDDEFTKKLSSKWANGYKKYRDNWIEYPKKQIVSDYPLLVDIELASICNLKCPMCYTISRQFKESVNTKRMEWELYKKIIDEIAFKVPAVRLSLRGESTLNKNFIECIKYAKKNGIKEVSTLTHGFKLNLPYFDEITKAGIDWITISIDGVEDTYNEIRKPLKFEDLLNKIKEIKKYKEKNQLKKPVIKVQGIWPAIAKDPKKYYNTFAPLVDQVAYNPLIDYLWKDKDIEYLDNDFACPQQYQRLVIGADGLVMKCSNDEENKETVGDINKETVYDIWHGEKLTKVRELHKKFKGYLNSPVCKKCYLPRKTQSDEFKINGRKLIVKNYTKRTQIIGK